MQEYKDYLNPNKYFISCRKKSENFLFYRPIISCPFTQRFKFVIAFLTRNCKFVIIFLKILNFEITFASFIILSACIKI